jgi:hypothetical protein
MWSRLLCFILGHWSKKAFGSQVQFGQELYTICMCGRCHIVYIDDVQVYCR